MTTISSLFAYVWLYIVLTVSSEGKITLWEAWVTFLFFPILLAFSYIADRFNARKLKKKRAINDLEQAPRSEQIKELTPDDFYYVLDVEKKESAKSKKQRLDTDGKEKPKVGSI